MNNARVETNESQLNMNVIGNLPDGMSNIIKAIQQIKDPMNELASSQNAKVFYGISCCGSGCKCNCDCNCKCECNCDDSCEDLKVPYNTSIITRGVEKFFFKNLAYLNLFGISADCRVKKISDITLSSTNEYVLNNGSVFSEAIRTSGCTFCRCTSIYFDVHILNEKRLAGAVKIRGICQGCCGCQDCCKTELCSCYKYYYCCEILNHNKDNIYNIYIRQCRFNCCPVDCCGNIDFAIKNTSGNTVGEIKCKKDTCSCCGFKCVYNISFPVDCTPEIKLTIINAVIVIDLFYIRRN